MESPALVQQIRHDLVKLLSEYPDFLVASKDKPNVFEVTGTIPAQQGKQKVDGHYFASVVPKAKDCRLCFFPIYTHKEEIPALSDELQKMLKGKSCFHVKKWNDSLQEEIRAMVKKGVELYRKDGLI